MSVFISKLNQRLTSRRRFLQKTLTGLGAILALASTQGTNAEGVDTGELPQKSEAKGYQETDHVRRYYERARF